ncbi:MAG: outer membrane protein assembly factor BamD [Bacteroidales bacterium]|nr:outer membrane protein assembly factor BamD [Bacteroidales bacterium]MBK9359558.1 outer membrane protein assembly factor BamD [Bacteroidales bacterium]
MIRKSIFSLLILVTIALSSCSKYQKLVKSTDNEKKYEMAIAYYEDKDYYRAIQLFDQLMPLYRGTEKAERMAYYYANANYEQKDYILASYYFSQFSKNFPNSKHAEEAAFMSAYCNYLDSPPETLDQTVTYDAIQDLQLFINQYPKSERVSKANELIDELRLKLETKALNIAVLYFKMNDYKAAVINYQNLVKDFPDTKYRETAMFHIAKAYYYYAGSSITQKQGERYQLCAEAVDNFLANFPESDKAKEALQIQKNAKKYLDNLTILQ